MRAHRQIGMLDARARPSARRRRAPAAPGCVLCAGHTDLRSSDGVYTQQGAGEGAGTLRPGGDGELNFQEYSRLSLRTAGRCWDCGGIV